MAKKSKFTLYKYCRTDAGWRYCKAAFSSNGKIKRDVVIVGGQEQKHPEGSYYLANKGQWIPVDDDALEAQRSARCGLHSWNSKGSKRSERVRTLALRIYQQSVKQHLSIGGNPT